MHLIDSHAHVDSGRFDNDREAVIKRAREAGLVSIINPGASLESSRAAVTLADRIDFIYATVGIHPHDAKTLRSRKSSATIRQELRALAQHPKVVAIGEIGLDYYRDLSPRPVQRQAFSEQLALATELGLPVVIHSRDAHDDTLAILRDWEGTGVMHAYAAGLERLDQVLGMGFYVSIAGPVTFKKAEQLRQVAARAPLDRLLIETDSPYMTPEPHRGKRNEPAYVHHVAQAIAKARHVTKKKVALATTDNACRLFGIDG
jgi:TatD DNase family protein